MIQSSPPQPAHRTQKLKNRRNETQIAATKLKSQKPNSNRRNQTKITETQTVGEKTEMTQGRWGRGRPSEISSVEWDETALGEGDVAGGAVGDEAVVGVDDAAGGMVENETGRREKAMEGEGGRESDLEEEGEEGERGWESDLEEGGRESLEEEGKEGERGSESGSRIWKREGGSLWRKKERRESEGARVGVGSGRGREGVSGGRRKGGRAREREWLRYEHI
ncbi:hypothetical protein LR48_Vigan10g138100 [Vigna angularis]|uniref:Uncharacterized protein n=1 Tax=Phaseolus angularis TaxID=3914 RepID=A0A0L9VL95_PHAAN|nr:hypothetical protein LR48_Vigan10g138100 [Vigna angularis]